jgi:hypothetical protein
MNGKRYLKNLRVLGTETFGFERTAGAETSLKTFKDLR